MTKLSIKIEDMIVAIAFVEAGEFEFARKRLTGDDDCSKSETRTA